MGYWREWVPWVVNPKTSTMAEVKAEMIGDESVTFLVMLFENPSSPFQLPGATTLFNHDCWHIILRRGLLPQDEAFVIGFSMGTDEKCKWYHKILFKFIAKYIYKEPYRFDNNHVIAYDLGFEYARTLEKKNLHKYSFKRNQNRMVESIAVDLGITKEDLNKYRAKERELIPNTKESQRLNPLIKGVTTFGIGRSIEGEYDKDSLED